MAVAMKPVHGMLTGRAKNKLDSVGIIVPGATGLISGMHVSPVEIEGTLLVHPDTLITDVSVAGILGGCTWDERISSRAGATLGEPEVMARLGA